MKFLQFRGPFSNGDVIEVTPPLGSYSDDTEFVFRHIGIQIPRKQPIFESESPENINASIFSPDVQINTRKFRVSQTGLLEFDNLYLESCEITILKKLGADTIIDIGYEPKEEI